MKLYRMFAAVAMATALVASSCQKYDDTDIVNRVTVLEGKVSNLEGALSSLNNAVSSKYAVESVEQTAEGWTINFTNGKKIELVNGKDGANGVDGVNGTDGKDGDSFLKSISENDEYVIIVLNDEKNTTFMLPKEIKVTIGSEESSFVLIDDVNNEVELGVPAIENIASVAGTVYGKDGNTTDVVTKANASGWSVKIAKDFSKATIIPENVAKGSRALFVVTLTKKDGTTFTSSKPIIYFMTDDTAYEQFAQDFESLQQQWTMVNNFINNNEDYADEKYDALKDEAAVALQGVYMNMQTKQQWADESYEAGTLAEDLDEILASFEEVQIQLTQVKNTFEDGVKAMANDEAFELFAQEYESLQKNYTFAYNSTFGNEEYENYDLTEVEEIVLPLFSAVQQMIDTKMTWATESYEAGTLAEDLEEILASFEEVNIALTQAINRFNSEIAAMDEDKAFEEFDAMYRDYQTQISQVYNVTFGNEENEDFITEEIEETYLPIVSALTQQLETKMTWATECYEEGTLAEKLDEILSTFEEIQIQMTQYLNAFNNAIDEVKAKMNDEAYEEIAPAIEGLQIQLTQMMNASIYSEEFKEWISDEELESELLAAFSGVTQEIETLLTWASESYEAGTLYKDMDEIYAQFDGIQTHMTQVSNRCYDAVDEAKNNAAFEAFDAEYRSFQEQWTSIYNAVKDNDEAVAALSAVSQNLADMQTWATESYEAGTLFDDFEEIMEGFTLIQRQLTQILNTYGEE